MFYYPQEAVDVRIKEGTSSRVPHVLRHHCADVNLVTMAYAELAGHITTTALSTGMNVTQLGTVDTSGVYLYLLPGTPQEVRLKLTEALVISNTDLFNLHVDNRQMKPVGDILTQYPTAQLHVYLLDSTG